MKRNQGGNIHHTYDTPTATEHTIPESLAFSQWGDTLITDQSGPWVPHYNHSVVDVLILRTAGTSAMTVSLYKNGVVFGTVSTIASGLTMSDTFEELFVADLDVVTVATTTIGTDTAKPTVQVYFR